MKNTALQVTIANKASVTLNIRYMTSIYAAIWIIVVIFVAMGISELTEVVDFSGVLLFGFGIPLTFILGYASASVLLPGGMRFRPKKILQVNVQTLESKTTLLSYIFICIASLEFVVEGYVPLILMAKGADISHFDFGIQSVHGFLMSLGALLFTCWFVIYNISLTSRKKCLFFMSIIICFFALSVTRKMIVVAFIQAAIVAYTMRKNNTIFIKVIIASLLCTFAFGAIGDIRISRELFLDLSRIPNYPEWLPSGLGWVYIYITTPVLNLTNAYSLSPAPTFDFSFMLQWLPSFIRSIFIQYDQADSFLNFWQISGAFNVGSGFMPIYLSFGIVGVFLFSYITGLIYKIISSKISNIAWFLVFTIYTECLYLLIFNNNFFNLNTASQMAFAFFLLSNKKQRYPSKHVTP